MLFDMVSNSEAFDTKESKTMVSYTKGRTRIIPPTPASPKKGDAYTGFLNVEVAERLRTVKVVPCEHETPYSHENLGELLAFVEDKALEFAGEDGDLRQHVKQVAYLYDGPNPQLACVIGFGGKPYVRIGDPNFVPRKTGRTKEYKSLF
jgi:hypothetical protein